MIDLRLDPAIVGVDGRMLAVGPAGWIGEGNIPCAMIRENF